MTLIDKGWLPPDGGHEVYWEMSGNPEGPTALVLHGGPGSGCRPAHYDLFDLSVYRVILMDQRGAGRSKPSAAASLTALNNNTTDDLLRDIERLRQHLRVERWLIQGGSWGTTLAMLYAQSYPERVKALVLSGIATTARWELSWLYEEVGNYFPEAHAAFRSFVPKAEGVWGRIGAYSDAMADTKRAQQAADAWCRWELGIFEQDFEGAGAPWTDPSWRLGWARIVTHYFRHFIWRDDRHVHDNIHLIADIPGYMVHSRFDPSAPLRSAWEIAQKWPAAQLDILDGNAHSSLSGEMRARLRAATDRFRDLA